MAHTYSWAANGKDDVPGWQHGEVGYELTRAAWLARGVSRASDS